MGLRMRQTFCVSEEIRHAANVLVDAGAKVR